MLQLKKIVGSIFSSNIFLLSDGNTSDYWIIDIGDFEALKTKLPQNAQVKGIFLTHGHFDHLADINNLYNNFPELLIYTSEYGVEQLLSDKKNFSFYHEKSTIFSGSKESIVVLNNNDKIKLFDDIYLNVITTPGHCPSCLTYYTDNYIFTGDSYIPDIKVVTNLPKGNKIQAQESVEKIKALMGNRTICPGHGEMIITT